MIGTAIVFNIIAILVGYLIGSVNNSIIVSKFFLKHDVRKTGSGNAGATNIARKIGFMGGMFIWFVDWFKVVLIVLFFFLLKYYLPNTGFKYVYVQLAGFAALLGHVWPIYFEFKGGKGVSAMFGLFVAFNWIVALIVLIVFWTCIYLLDKVSLASIIALTFGSIFAFIPFFISGTTSTGANYTYMLMDMPGYPSQYNWLTGVTFVFSGIIIIIKHTQNIGRVIRKTESSFRVGILKREAGCKIFINKDKNINKN